jgi:hypothetical protein
MNRTFLLGVGAQKAGTTWLHRTVSSSEQANFGIKKGYHIWDAISSDLFSKFLVTDTMLSDGLNNAVIRYKMQNIPGYYSSYFNGLLSGNCTISGDVTPSYAALSSEDWVRVRTELKLINARLCIVFLMRDPFERCWSSVRMEKRKNNKLTVSDDLLLLETYSSPQFVARTRYDHTVNNLRTVFSENELYFGIYETMYKKNELQRLSDFLGICLPEDAVNQLYNASPKKESVSLDTANKVRNYYSEVYDFCKNEFTDCRSSWSQY